MFNGVSVVADAAQDSLLSFINGFITLNVKRNQSKKSQSFFIADFKQCRQDNQLNVFFSLLLMRVVE